MPELKAQAREVWRLSLPAILTHITTIAMQYIDSAMVGALGANASASIGLVSTSTWLIGGIIGGVSAGFSVQASHRIGGGDALVMIKPIRGSAELEPVLHRVIADFYSRFLSPFAMNRLVDIRPVKKTAD